MRWKNCFLAAAFVLAGVTVDPGTSGRAVQAGEVKGESEQIKRLEAEKARLVARLAEIEARLGKLKGKQAPPAQPDGKRPPLAEEIDLFRGTWRSPEREAAVEVKMKFGKAKDGRIAVTQTWSRLGKSVTVAEVLYTLKEEGKSRFLRCPKKLADSGKCPDRIEFRFDKGDLILKVPAGKFEDGEFAGEYQLSKSKDD